MPGAPGGGLHFCFRNCFITDMLRILGISIQFCFGDYTVQLRAAYWHPSSIFSFLFPVLVKIMQQSAMKELQRRWLKIVP